MLLKVRAKF